MELTPLPMRTESHLNRAVCTRKYGVYNIGEIAN